MLELAPKPGRRGIQSLSFSRKISPPEVREGRGWTDKAARAWAEARGFRTETSAAGSRDTLRLIQFETRDCSAGSIKPQNEGFPAGVGAVMASIDGDPAEAETLDLGGELEIRGKPGQPPRIRGYAAIFDEPTTLWPGHREIVRPGAFSRAIEERQEVHALRNHDATAGLGVTTVSSGPGSLRIWQDDHGLGFEVEPMQTQAGIDTIEEIRVGYLTGASFGFRAVDAPEKIEDGLTVRELRDVDLVDVSPVTYPAYGGTAVALRAARDAILAREREVVADLPAAADSGKLSEAMPVARYGDSTPHRAELEKRLREITLSALDI